MPLEVLHCVSRRVASVADELNANFLFQISHLGRSPPATGYTDGANIRSPLHQIMRRQTALATATV